MFKRLLILVTLTTLLGAETFAQERPLLPFYWIRGEVQLPGGTSAGAGRRVVLYLAANPAITAEAVTDANGGYALNIYDLYYYRGANFTFSDIRTLYQLGVRPDLSTVDRFGYAQEIYPTALDSFQGYVTQPALVLAPQSGFRVRSSSIVGGNILTANANLGIPGGSNQSVQLEWGGNVPLGTRSFALSMVDTSLTPNFTHWLVKNIPATTVSLPAGASMGAMPAVSTQLPNDFGMADYGGPEPPDASTHNYVITVYALSDVLPDSVNNMSTFTTALAAPGLVLGQASTSGTFTRGAASAGAVPLTITRAGNDVEIRWTAADNPNPRIFFRTGDGSGQFSNAYDAAGWTQVTAANAAAAGFDFATYGSGSILHTGQVGGGANEAYYKAVTSTTDVLIPGGAAVFESAGAVGKVNAALSGTAAVAGYNLVGIPFALSSTAIPDVFGTGNPWQSGDQILRKTGPSPAYLTAVYDASNPMPWRNAANTSNPAGFTIDQSYGYFVRVAANKTITLVGSVPTTPPQASVFGGGYTILSLMYPTSVTLDGSGLSPLSSNGDMIFYKSSATSPSYIGAVRSGGNWMNLANTGQSPAANISNLRLPYGYFYSRSGAGFTWTRSLP